MSWTHGLRVHSNREEDPSPRNSNRGRGTSGLFSCVPSRAQTSDWPGSTLFALEIANRAGGRAGRNHCISGGTGAFWRRMPGVLALTLVHVSAKSQRESVWVPFWVPFSVRNRVRVSGPPRPTPFPYPRRSYERSQASNTACKLTQGSEKCPDAEWNFPMKVQDRYALRRAQGAGRQMIDLHEWARCAGAGSALCSSNGFRTIEGRSASSQLSRAVRGRRKFQGFEKQVGQDMQDSGRIGQASASKHGQTGCHEPGCHEPGCHELGSMEPEKKPYRWFI
ncbi:predicted protein [Verticillium alfalfae VaMs.102]|uniref:Predicted protein n=1 Tax=Verticillium alfalfae (strain VaMs.102 / ATCC MYA-4576 / FGSC 10136) TaxID=526221 RepID=C9SLA8_VERA1|nr:predicted protein [Verticillium alfalfae VaMs.102]EEY19476.1 predicted protein [Verticillium alfalfae VaMs.102]